MSDRSDVVPNDPQPIFFASQWRRLEGYTGPIMRVCVGGVEKDIYHFSEVSEAYHPVKLYNQSSKDGTPAVTTSGFKVDGGGNVG